MKIDVKKPGECPLRELNGSVFTCAANIFSEIICDSEETDDFPFPDDCPLKQDGQIIIKKVSDD